MRRAIALDPQESGYHYLLGMMLAAAGDFDAARQAQPRALVIDPQNVQAYIALSNLALLQNGDVDAATRSAAHTSELHPLLRITHADFCLQTPQLQNTIHRTHQHSHTTIAHTMLIH